VRVREIDTPGYQGRDVDPGKCTFRDSGNAGKTRETGIVRKSGYLLTGSDGSESSAAFLMPGKPYLVRAPAFLRTGEFMKDSGRDAGSFFVHSVLCEALLSGVRETNRGQ
jgi:hypothetical protein